MVRTSIRDTRGYALLATLWICVGIGAFTLLISVITHDAIGASRNRIAMTSGIWRARACLTFERETLAEALAQQDAASIDSIGSLWNYIDRFVAERPPAVSGCSITARAVGARLDINAVPESTIARVLQLAGWSAARADSAAAAVADWMDADDQPRAKGAERDWYVAQNREPPSNSPLVHIRELHRIRGFEEDRANRLDSIFDIEPGAISLNQAPREILALLPGFTERTVREVLDARARGDPVTAFIQLRPWLNPETPEAGARLPGLITLAPMAWLLTARTQTGFPPVTTVIEARLAHGYRTTAITHSRTWTE